MPRKRSYEIRLPGVLPPDLIRVNGEKLMAAAAEGAEGWWYDPEVAEVRIRTSSIPISSRCAIEIRGAALLPAGAMDLRGRLAALKRVMPLLNNLWPKEWSPSDLVRLAQTGTRISARPSTAGAEIDSFIARWPRVMEELGRMEIDPAVRRKVLTRLSQPAK